VTRGEAAEHLANAARAWYESAPVRLAFPEVSEVDANGAFHEFTVGTRDGESFTVTVRKF
jgi:hypothetical protein